jgi:hypothetical protein
MAYYWDGQTKRDRPLGFHWRSSGLADELGLDPADRALESLLTEACLAAEDGCAVSYSRSKDFYAGTGRYHGTGWSYRSVLRSVAEAERLGLIRDRRVPPGNRGWQSWLEATDKLMGVWQRRPLALHHSPGDPIVLRDANGDSIGYHDTAMTARLRGELRAVNDMLSSIKIEVDGVTWRGRHMVFTGADGAQSLIRPLPANPLRRIFARSSFRLGGRAYGWHQNIPKEWRKRIRINGTMTTELDFRAMHLSMLYNEANTPMPAGDPYEIPGRQRVDVKLAVNIALNAATTQGAIGALSQAAGFSAPNDRTKAAEVICAVRTKHNHIAGAFGSDAGIRLMRRDSDIMMRALKILNADGTPALPVHDSLVVQQQHTRAAEAAMSRAWAELSTGPNTARVN